MPNCDFYNEIARKWVKVFRIGNYSISSRKVLMKGNFDTLNYNSEKSSK